MILEAMHLYITISSEFALSLWAYLTCEGQTFKA